MVLGGMLLFVSACGATEEIKTETLSGTVPDELEYIPEEYKEPEDHPGTLEKLTYETWESFSYEDHSQKLTKEVCVYLPYGYDENEKYNVFYLSHCGWTVYGRAGKTTGA